MMQKQGKGHIVNMSSIGGKRGASYGALYCGTKAALDRWAEGMRLELTGTGVNISTIFPGYVLEEGMFARFNMRPPMLLGSCKPRQVADAVYKSIVKNRSEMIVNSMPIRPLLALGQSFPHLGDMVVKAFGIPGFQKRKVEKGTG
jgi:short-subunit dehydrogenase